MRLSVSHLASFTAFLGFFFFTPSFSFSSISSFSPSIRPSDASLIIIRIVLALARMSARASVGAWCDESSQELAMQQSPVGHPHVRRRWTLSCFDSLQGSHFTNSNNKKAMLLFHIFFYFNLNHLPVIYLCMCAFLDSHPYIRIYVRECVCVTDRITCMYFGSHTQAPIPVYTHVAIQSDPRLRVGITRWSVTRRTMTKKCLHLEAHKTYTVGPLHRPRFPSSSFSCCFNQHKQHLHERTHACSVFNNVHTASSSFGETLLCRPYVLLLCCII